VGCVTALYRAMEPCILVDIGIHVQGRGMAVDGCTDDRRPVVNGRITLHAVHGDDARCVYGRVTVASEAVVSLTNSEQMR